MKSLALFKTRTNRHHIQNRQEFNIVISSNKSNLINEKILADRITLIDSEGNNLGSVTTQEALKLAEKSNLDLVQVSPKSSEKVVCKLMDFGKHVFAKKKNASSSKSKTKKTSLKEIKFRPSTDIGDYNIKLKKIKDFILNKNKTKISVRFRGREILNSNLGLDLLNRLKNELSDIAQVDQEPSLEGRQLMMVLSPIKKS